MSNRQLADMVDQIAVAIYVLRTRDGFDLTAEHCRERANNIVQLITANYHLTPRYPEETS